MSSPEILQRVFVTKPRGEQQAIIKRLAGRDALVLMPTGGGKSRATRFRHCCARVPASSFRHSAHAGSGRCPARAGRARRVSGRRRNGARRAKSAPDAQRRTRSAVRGPAAHRRCMELLQRSRIALFAIDEAHCVYSGARFPPGIPGSSAARILARRARIAPRPPPPPREEIARRLRLEEAAHFVPFDRPNILYRIVEKTRSSAMLSHPRRAPRRAASYCLSRSRVEDMAAFLSQNGVPALPYHAGMDASVRASPGALREEGLS